VAASYIDALLPAPFDTGSGGIRDWRWNNTEPVGNAFNLTYAFMDSVPAYATGSNGTGFAAFTADQKAAANAVLDIYEEISLLTFTGGGNGENAQILFGSEAQSGSAGQAYYPDLFFVPAGELGGDVWLDNDTQSNFNELDPGGYGWTTLIHEIGHALGLKHPFDDEMPPNSAASPTLPPATDTEQYTVMSYDRHPRYLFRTVTETGGGYTVSYESIHPETPMLYDIAAIQYLYGQNMATRSGNTVYSFQPDDPFLMCIWDGGGTDTISVSSFSKGCTINLNPGTFSSITILSDAIPDGGSSDPNEAQVYNGTNNLSIAFGCTIENATGGSGNDKLTGNSKGNTLLGNNGNDILDGGGGNDKLTGGAGKDKLTGGAGNDTLTCESKDTRIDGGGGKGDILKFSGKLDLVAITDQARIKGIEKIDMTGGIQTLKLGKSDVLDISNTTNTLTVLGDAGDTVDVVGFTRSATAGGLVTWKAGSAILKIDQDIVNVI
jgi:serralysin